MVVHICNPNIHEAEASLGYIMRLYLNNNKNPKQNKQTNKNPSMTSKPNYLPPLASSLTSLGTPGVLTRVKAQVLPAVLWFVTEMPLAGLSKGTLG